MKRTRQLFLVLVILLTVWAVSGCAMQPQSLDDSRDLRYRWAQVPTYPPIENVQFAVVDYGHYLRRCGPRALGNDACAERDYTFNICTVVSYAPIEGSYLEFHERKHCKGYEHPGRS